MSEVPVLIAKDARGVATVTINRPNVRNAIDDTVIRLLTDAFTGLGAACDIAVAVEQAVFSISEVRIGLTPSTISPYVVAAIGARAARRYFLTGEPFLAADASQLGLVHQVVAESALDGAVESLIA